MASTKTKVKPIRIANETADFFEGKPLNRVVECIHHLLENGRLKFDGDEIKISGENSVYTEKKGINPGILEDMDSMAACFGVTTEKMIEEFYGMLEEGTLTVENGKLKASMPEWASNFEEACHEMCVPVEKVAESAVKALKKGQI